MIIISFLFAIWVICSAMVQSQLQVVDAPAGEIHGVMTTFPYNGEDIDVSIFYGIPYALPPTGDLRFARPVRAPKFESPFIANESKSSCMQVVAVDLQSSGIKSMSEDCLNLNVFAPGAVTPLGPKRAVMVWIYGGSFIEGSQDIYLSPGFTFFNDVIYVTLNYRLSMFGFLSTGGYDLTGNYGLWDQHMALQWVHDNIASFGGDPGNVTVFGQSAGGASVMYQALYRGNADLFQRVIVQSGTVSNDWSFNDSPLDMFYEIVKNTNCSGSSRSESITCLRQLDSTALLNSIPARTVLAPSVDREFVLMDPALLYANMTDESAFILKHFGDLDLLIGVTSDDGAMETRALEMFNETTGITKAQFKYLISRMDPSEAVNTAILFQYTDWSKPEGSVKQKLVDLYTDFQFTAPMIKTAMVHARIQGGGKTFVYEFDYKSSFATTPDWVTGADHSDELLFVFGMSFLLLGFDMAAIAPDNEKELSVAIMRYWTQFAKTGDVNNPNGSMQQWPEYTITDQEYLVLQSGTPFPVQQRMRDENVNFWNVVVPAIQKRSRAKCDNSGNDDEDVNGAEQLRLPAFMICVACLWFYMYELTTETF